MATIEETGDEWIVEPVPVVVPVDEPAAVPASVPVEAPKGPVTVGGTGG